MENVEEKSFLLITQDAITIAKSLEEAVAVILDADSHGVPVWFQPGHKAQLTEAAHKVLIIDAVRSMKNGRLAFPDCPSEFGTYQRKIDGDGNTCFLGIEQFIGRRCE